MTSDEFAFLSREELLGGLPARRASTLLFAIESRTAHLVVRSRQAMAHYLTEKTAEGRERAFLEALAQGRDLPLSPTIQDLERYAPLWAPLVSDDPSLRAAIAQLLSQKYDFTVETVPAIRAALELDDATVQQTFEHLYHQPIDAIFVDRLGPTERIRWVRSRFTRQLESMPPFWAAFSLTLTEMVGAGILALPIALARVGPLAGVMLLLILGLINVLTISGIAEAVIRNGNMRYGNTYFGRLVGDYLGNLGTFVITLALLLLNALTLLAFYVGVATTLADATSVPAEVWSALLFLVGLYFLRRETIEATVASALLVGAANISLILILSLLALPHVRASNLRYLNVPFVNGQSFTFSILELIFGVALMAYFGHTSAANAAKIVLRHDSSGRTLIWGNVAAVVAAAGLYSVWVVTINGAIVPAVLATAPGTALTPLAEIAGPIVYLFGSVYVILSMGMGSIYAALGLFYQVREWLPAQPRSSESLAQSPTDFAHRVREIVLGQRGQTWLSAAPVVFVFLLIEWLLLANRESFSGTISFAGVVTVPVLGGIFPMLMLVASRRKGDYLPGLVFRFLGHPFVIVCVYLLFLASLALHGLVIWQDPLQRSAALFVGGVILVITFIFIRGGALTPRTVVELRVDQDMRGRAVFNIISDGKPLPANVRLEYPDDEQLIQAASGEVPNISSLRNVKIQLPATQPGELKVWTHTITPEGNSQALPTLLKVSCGNERRDYDLSEVDGQAMLQVPGEACWLELVLTQPSVEG